MSKKWLVSILLYISLMLSGCTSNDAPIETTKEDVVKAGLSNIVSKEQSLYFNLLATDGLAAYSLVKLLYEQPEIEDGVKLEYILFTQEYLTKTDIDKRKDNFAVLPFELAIQTMIRIENYKLVGVVKPDGDTAYKLALLVTGDVFELHPELVESFVRQYLQSCSWLTRNPERALAYAESLGLVDIGSPAPAESMVYYNASRSAKAIGAYLTELGYPNDILDLIVEQTVNVN